MITNIGLRRLEKPVEPDIIQDINWICKSLGLVSSRDSDETASKIFNVIINAMAENEELSSEQIARQIDVTRGTVIYHLKSFTNAGLISQNKTRYLLRTRSMERTVEEVEMDILRVLNDIKKMAREVDIQLGLKER